MSFLETAAGRWGLLPVAVPATAFVAMRLGALAFPNGRGTASDRAISGAVLTIALYVAGVRVLGAFHGLSTGVLAAALVVVALALAFVGREKKFVFPWRDLVARETAPILLVVVAGIGLAVLAACWLPVWQWDSLGYHLPYVNFALVAHDLSGVPPDIRFLSTYPHDVELFVIALRAMLPDDRLVDLAQVPLGLVGAIAIAGIARRFGAERPHAAAAGALWLVVPAVFLQLPTNYVDVGSVAFLLAAVYFLLAPPSPRALALAGVALGLYLGSKPNAPIGTAIMGLVLVVRGWKAKELGFTLVAVGLVLLFGAESFVVNTVRHGNPIWPVVLTLGPIHLPGTMPMRELLDSGAAAPRVHGPLLYRVARSWTTLTSPPVFDMRIGGLGPIFLVALPAAVVTLVRRRKDNPVTWSTWVAWAAVLATLASPDPAVARYVLAFPGLVLALAAPRVLSLPRTALPLAGLAAALAGIFQLWYASPGLIGEGPPLLAYATMSEEERALAVGADGRPFGLFEARKRIGPGETFAFDRSFDLPYLSWDRDLRYRAVWIPDELSGDAVGDLLEREHVRVFVAGDDTPAGDWVRRHPERVVRLFPCKSVSCSVYATL